MKSYEVRRIEVSFRHRTDFNNPLSAVRCPHGVTNRQTDRHNKGVLIFAILNNYMPKKINNDNNNNSHNNNNQNNNINTNNNNNNNNDNNINNNNINTNNNNNCYNNNHNNSYNNNEYNFQF